VGIMVSLVSGYFLSASRFARAVASLSATTRRFLVSAGMDADQSDNIVA
jgi:hypothetical protein